jgi:hypothetical protein
MRRDQDETHRHSGEHVWEDRDEVAIFKSRREASEGASSADTLILDFLPPDL